MKTRRLCLATLAGSVALLIAGGAAACSGRDDAGSTPTVVPSSPASPTPLATPTAAATPLPTVGAGELRAIAVEVATARVVRLPVGLNSLGRRTAWSRNSSWVAVAGDEGLAVGTVGSPSFLRFASGKCFDVEWSPVADLLAAVCAQRLAVFDKDGRLVAEAAVSQADFTAKQPTVHWAPDGQVLAYGPLGRTVKVLRLAGTEAEVKGAFTDFQWAAGGYLVTFEEPRLQPPSTVRLHDPARGFAAIAEYTTPERSTAVGVDPTGTYVAYGVYGAERGPGERVLSSTFYIVRLGDAAVVATFESAYGTDYNRTSFAPDGSAALMMTDYCRPETWTLDIGSIDGTKRTLARGGAMALKFSPDGRWVGYTKGIELWVVRSDGAEPPRKLADDIHGPAGFEWSPDSRWISVPPFFGGFDQCP